jgi:hypothetical protein
MVGALRVLPVSPAADRAYLQNRFCFMLILDAANGARHLLLY